LPVAGRRKRDRACRLRAADHRLGACRTRRDLDRGGRPVRLRWIRGDRHKGRAEG